MIGKGADRSRHECAWLERRSKLRLYEQGYSGLFGDAVFFVLGAEDAVNGVGGAAAGFVVVTALHFSQQADGEEV